MNLLKTLKLDSTTLPGAALCIAERHRRSREDWREGEEVWSVVGYLGTVHIKIKDNLDSRLGANTKGFA